jgi:type I restriction enzyme M protein
VLIGAISDDLLARFRSMPLVDEYDVYEQLMTYWHSIMHDDVFLIMYEGWLAAAKPRTAIEDKDRKISETPDLVSGTGRKATKFKTDLIPPALIVARYFADEQVKFDELTAAVEEATRIVEEYVEEHAVEGGLLAEAMDDDKITKALATARLKVAKRDGSDPDEVAALNHLIKLYNAEAEAKKVVREAQTALDLATLKKYGDLTVANIKSLVLDDKWHSTISSRVASEGNSLTLALVSRIQQLGERYTETVSAIDARLEKLESKVAAHLAEMGVKK